MVSAEPDRCFICQEAVHESYEELPVKQYLRAGRAPEVCICYSCVAELHDIAEHNGNGCPGCLDDVPEAAKW